MKEQVKSFKTTLMGQVAAQMGNLDKVDTKELGEVVDMIKDLAETEYYCSIVDAMEEKSKEPSEVAYYREYPIYRDMDRYTGGRMYYDDRSGGTGRMNYDDTNSGSGRYFHDRMMPYYMRDVREGRSPEARRNYMESKELHQDKTTQMHELEMYLKELSNDITEMIEDATPEERTMLRDKMTTLASKIK